MNRILQSIEDINSKIKPRTKLIISVVLFTWFVLSSLFSHVIFGKWDFREIVTNSSLVILIVGSLYMKKRNWNKDFFKSPILISLFFMGFCFLFNSILFKVLGYLALGLQALIVFLYYWLGISGDKKKVIFSIALGFIISYIVVLLMMFFLGPEFTLFQNSGLFGNPNLMGYYLTTIATSDLYFLCRDNEKKPFKILEIVLLGSVLFITFCTTSRTSIACIAIEIVLAIIYYLQKKYFEFKRSGRGFAKGLLTILRDLILTLSIMVVTAFLVYMIFVEWKPRFEQFFYGRPSTFYEDYLYDPSAAMSDELDSSLNYYTKGLDDHDWLNFTSGRIEIWKIFLDEIRMVGHKTETLFITFSSRVNRAHGAHNIFLQLAYSIGIPAGVCYFVTLAITDLYYFIRLICPSKRGRISAEEIIILLSASVLTMNALTSSGYLFGRYLVPSYFVLVIGPRQKTPALEEGMNSEEEPETEDTENKRKEDFQ